MKNKTISKLETNQKRKKHCYILQNSLDKINKNWQELSVSISGDFCCETFKCFRKKFINTEFEMF